jgi:hypothetical protein
LAEIADGDADSLRVEIPHIGASQAELFGPVPVGASFIDGFDQSEILDQADAVEEVVSLVAGEAGSDGGVEGQTLIADGDASVLDEDPVSRASQTDFVVPVPSGTAQVRYLLFGGFFASSGHKSVAFVAGDAVSTQVEGVALVGNRGAYTLVVEDPVIGASDADQVAPVPEGTSQI